ncbi:MAG: hypothetical protein GY869_25115 [Planctomycetes bacterium]|nr:hypothetical protein [Planctomycetota bacterium]
MSRSRRRSLPKSTFLLGGVVCIALLAAFLAQATTADELTADQQQRQRAPRPQPKVKVGELAPDFNLPLLTIDSNAAGKSIGKINDNNKIRLSNYFGKKPVCMIMSSYT